MKRKKTVAIIEDDILFADDLKQLFESNGFDAVNFNSFEGIGSSLKSLDPSLIVCDINFPEGRANYLIHKIRGNRFFNLIPIVVLTGASLDDKQIDELLLMGVSGIFFKPTPFDEFLKSINKILKEQKEHEFTESYLELVRYPFRIINYAFNWLILNLRKN